MPDAPITDAELQEWQRLHEQATPGPWEYRDSRTNPEDYTQPNGVLDSPAGGVNWSILGGNPDEPSEGWALLHGQAGGVLGTMEPAMSDVRVVIAARNALPRLIAEVRRLRADLATAQDVCRQLADRCASQSEALSRKAERIPPPTSCPTTPPNP